jgi:response regulator RpfG family c-di-GMP phosphodiesterase
MMPSLPDLCTTRVSRPTCAAERPRSPVLISLTELLDSGLILTEDWDALSPQAQSELFQCQDPRARLALLEKQGLLTSYQVSRIESGSTFGLILGNYRVLDHLGSGGMGVVFLGEHVKLRKQVAIKVLHPTHAHSPHLLTRFHHEIRAVARLQHPNVVGALDVGEVPSPDGHTLTLYYFVMEHVPGQDLEKLVKSQGPLPVVKACDIISQVAGALVEADKNRLVHRDIKPSNIQVTPAGQAKLLDFGLARLQCDRVTSPGMALGSLAYMAPEQAVDASGVDIRADLFALGGTLYWALTGRLPFPTSSNIGEALSQRRARPTLNFEVEGVEVPPGLRDVLKRMLAGRPEDRFQTPQEVMDALLPHLKMDLPEMSSLMVRGASIPHLPSAESTPAGPRVHKVLIVDDDPDVRQLCKSLLESPTLRCEEASDGISALEVARQKRYDLVLLDIDMPRMNGREVLRRLRETPPTPHLKVIMFSGRTTCDDMAQMLLAGADDYLPKPFSLVQVQARIKTALRFKDAQDRAEILNQHLRATNRELESSLTARDSCLVQARNSLVLALSKLVEYRDSETGHHLVRMQRYCQVLATEAAKGPPFDQQIDAEFVEILVGCVPLHDIGKAIVPDHILLKPGKLDPAEQVIVQGHTVAGREALTAITLQQGLSPAFLQMALDVVCHHHERYDGKGYPDQLAGTDIPLAARVVAVADVYDALRSRRVYKPSLSHPTAVQVLTKGSEGQFDPNLLTAFLRCANQFDHIFRECPD